jgi:hypothetical protein
MLQCLLHCCSSLSLLLLLSTDVTMNGILDSIVIGFLNGIEPSLGVGQQFLSGSHKLLKRAECIARALAASKNCLYIVLHNIDGIGLRNSVAQSSLAALVVHGTVNNVRRIRLVASMDHVNSAVFLWDARTRASFSWVSKAKRLLTLVTCSRSVLTIGILYTLSVDMERSHNIPSLFRRGEVWNSRICHVWK